MKLVSKILLATCGALLLGTPLMAQQLSKDPLTVKWFGGRGKPNPDAPVVKALQDTLTKKLGYKVTFELLGGQASDADTQQAMTLLFAANDLPDAFMKNTLTDDKFNDGAVVHISIDEYKTYMPRSYALMEKMMVLTKTDPKDAFSRYQDDKGLLLGAPRFSDTQNIPNGITWRKDLLDQLGFKAPPKTLAEVDKAFAAYKAKYPTLYPYSAFTKGNPIQMGEMVFAAYGIDRRGTWVYNDAGKLIKGQWDPKVKKALAVLQDWFKKGYINPEFFALTSQNAGDNFTAGNALVAEFSNYTSMAYSPRKGPDKLLDNVPGAQVVLGPYPTVEGGPKQPLVGAYYPFLGQYVGFGKHLAKDKDKLHKIMQVADCMANDKETRFLAEWGIEGVHYTIPEGEVAPVAKPEFTTKPALENTTTQGYGFYWFAVGSRPAVLLSAYKAGIAKNFEDPNGLYGANNVDYSFNPGPVWGVIQDESGVDLSKALVSDTSISWENVIVPIVLGKPITTFDELYQRYLKQGGEKEELYANKIYNKKK